MNSGTLCLTVIVELSVSLYLARIMRSTDRQGKTSEPATFTINTIQATLNLSNPSELPIGGSTLSLDVEFNGADLQKNVIFQYRNSRGTFDPCIVLMVNVAGSLVLPWRSVTTTVNFDALFWI